MCTCNITLTVCRPCAVVVRWMEADRCCRWPVTVFLCARKLQCIHRCFVRSLSRVLLLLIFERTWWLISVVVLLLPRCAPHLLAGFVDFCHSTWRGVVFFVLNVLVGMVLLCSKTCGKGVLIAFTLVIDKAISLSIWCTINHRIIWTGCFSWFIRRFSVVKICENM